MAVGVRLEGRRRRVAPVRPPCAGHVRTPVLARRRGPSAFGPHCPRGDRHHPRRPPERDAPDRAPADPAQRRSRDDDGDPGALRTGQRTTRAHRLLLGREEARHTGRRHADRSAPPGRPIARDPRSPRPPPPKAHPATCRSNLLSVDGRPLTVEVVGSTSAALADGQVSIVPCGKDARGIRLSAGHHVVESTLATTPRGQGPSCEAEHRCDGWNVDELTFDSGPGGGAERGGRPRAVTAPTGARSLPPPAPGRAPTVTARATSPTAWRLRVSRVSRPFELVLGESLNAGWRAVAHPAGGAPRRARSVTLGPPSLVDGFSNGWGLTRSQLATVGATGPGRDRAVTI